MRLYVFNCDLSEELGRQVIRHRRRTEHRLVRVGEEFLQDASRVASRMDRHVLHAAPGLDVQGDGELPHYLLMRCVNEMQRQEGKVRKSSLGTALTGCYSTLLESAEGKSVNKALGSSELGRTYLELLMGMVGKEQDAHHPKVRAIVERVIEAWHAGEKTLLFCFRSNTARRLHDILGERIARELEARTQRCLGGEKSMRALRSRLTRREGDLIGLGLDRVLWSYAWALHDTLDLASLRHALRLTSDDVLQLARLGLRYGIPLAEEDIDRVFLTRATEHVLARRLLRTHEVHGRWKLVLQAVAEPTWLESPYGLSSRVDTASGDEEGTGFDERGAHAAYAPGAEPSEAEVQLLAAAIEQRRERARRSGRVPLHDGYAEAPSLWLGTSPFEQAGADSLSEVISFLHAHLDRVTWTGSQLDWDGRRRLLQALRRAVLRESVLVRLLPEREEREEGSWGELLVSAFFHPLKGQRESMAHRVGVFLEDITAASGELRDPKSARHALLEATRLRDGFVSLVHGETHQDTRERIFAGFNTPLFPEVLICTSVGAEGIDLHRHCRHVIHYDMAWNPAVVEQRTGRVDRIGSKTFRERELAGPDDLCFLDVSVPFLAGTYDERMFEELRLRAQMFEVLTGGEVSADNVEGRDDVEEAEGDAGGSRLVVLPSGMVEDLRVRLHVWEDPTNLREEAAPSKGLGKTAEA